MEEFLDWKRQARETIWLLASDEANDVGMAIGVGGWHEPPGVARMELGVVPDARGRGVGSALLARRRLVGRRRSATASCWARCRRRTPRASPGRSGAGSPRWRATPRLVLDLAGVEAPDVAPPTGIEIVTWAERPRAHSWDLHGRVRGIPDVPDGEDDEMPSFEDWLSMDMQGASDRPEATFVALAGDEVVGYAKLHLSPAEPDIGWHDMTGVLRSWRRRGVAGALKRAEIAWAKENGFTQLCTGPQERNEPSRRLNESHGYRPEPGDVTVRGPI